MSCTLHPPCVIVPRALHDYPTPVFGARAQGKKAASNREENRVWVDRAFWEAIPDDRMRLALVAHEYAHLEGADCEECADRRGGQIVAALGVEGEPGAEMFRRMLEHRSGDRAA